MRFRYSRGFTLIELLVVISVIGMLSSVVLVSVQSARDKGRVAAGLKFATHNYHALGIDMVGFWDFNSTVQCTSLPINGLCIPNSAGGRILLKPMSRYDDFENPNSVGAFAPYISSNTPTGKGSSARIYASHYFGIDSTANIDLTISDLDIKPKDYTIAAWVYLDSQPSQSETVVSFGTDVGTTNQMASVLVGPSGFTCISGVHLIFDLMGGSLQVGKWQQVTCTFNGTTGVGVMYVDGKEVDRSTGGYDLAFYDEGPITRISIGFNTDDIDALFVSGNIDDVAIYESPLVASSVEQLYLAGLPEHTMAQK